MNTYACVYVGEVLHACQQQAALADVKNTDGRVRTSGWSLCAKWLDGKLVRGRPECAECLAACVLHEGRVADGSARTLPLPESERPVVTHDADGKVPAPGIADAVVQVCDMAVVNDVVADAREAYATAATVTRTADAAEDMIRLLLTTTPTLKNQAVVDAVRAAGLRASFGRVDKVRAQLATVAP